MNFEPQKFFIGLIDFFSILLPGAVLAYLTKDWAIFSLFGRPRAPLDDIEAWMVFLFSAYLLGHIAFLLGAKLLDDWLYEPIRSKTYLGQLRRLADGNALSGSVMRKLANWIFGSNPDVALMYAARIKSLALAPLSAEHAINAFQWCKASLSKEHPEGLAAVQRFEADSKFFRSFAVVLAVLAIFFFIERRYVIMIVCFALFVPVIWRYMDQRFKATQQAYWFVITLKSLKGPPAIEMAAQRKSGALADAVRLAWDTTTRVFRSEQGANTLTHAGGVVFRHNGASLEYLLVHASKNSTEWVLPKGHIGPGEDAREAAVREVYEETGHWAKVVEWIGDVRLGTNTNAPMTRIFLMEIVQEAHKWLAENRQRKWLPLVAAKQLSSFPETKALLEKAA
ncbi:MAG: NUDIX domain-containing protein, partial [Deltaproteobacteria bacterium]|nr:NUDIX domain-containing protein [Deltaproteobacteria bacterium]